MPVFLKKGAKVLVALLLSAVLPVQTLPVSGENMRVQGLLTYDVVVYGGTAAAIMAAISASREGVSVALVAPDSHLGGMVTGGLGGTDIGNSSVIGGIAREFFERVGKKYGTTLSWTFEPHVADAVFADMLGETSVQVFTQHRLKETGGVEKTGTTVTKIICENGDEFTAKQFIDATYEGDLMKQAGVTYTYGRESASTYNESLAGVVNNSQGHQFYYNVSAYDENNQLYPEINSEPRAAAGSGDKKIQAYNFRMCLTKVAGNKIPFPRPANYNADRYRLLLQWITTFYANRGYYPKMSDLFIINWLQNGKTDVNNNGPFSSDYIGGSWGYPDATYAQRQDIWQAHYDYTAGLFYFLSNDSRVPADTRNDIAQWGLAADEFTSSGNWPFQLYVREGRRMVGEYVMTQKDLQTDLVKSDAICMGSYNSDSHNVQRFVDSNGYVRNEGNMEVPVTPYEIPYRMLLPKSTETGNLLVACTFSASHVAYSSLRMEPQYMMIGQAAGIAASLAVKNSVTVQNVSVSKLRSILATDGAVLSLAGSDMIPDIQDKSVVFYDTFTNYKLSWQFTGNNGVFTQNASSVNFQKDSSNSYGYLTRKGFTPPTGAFSYSFRAKTNASGEAEFTVRSGLYQIVLALTNGTQGTAQDAVVSPAKKFTLNTTVYHDYQVVVHDNYTYDLYVGGALAWSGAASKGTGGNILKIGADVNQAANFDVDSFKLETGARQTAFRVMTSMFEDADGNKVASLSDAPANTGCSLSFENNTGAAQQARLLFVLYRDGRQVGTSIQNISMGPTDIVRDFDVMSTLPDDRDGLSVKVSVWTGQDYSTPMLSDLSF